MASYERRKNRDRSTSIVAWVRVKPYKPNTRTFPDMAAAKAWAIAREAQLREHRAQGNKRKDLPTLTIKGLLEAYLADDNTKKKKTYGGMVNLLGWWANHYGSAKVFEFGPEHLLEARGLLNEDGRAPATVNRYLSAMRSCWSWGRRIGSVQKVWPTGLLLSEPEGRKRFLNDDELEAVKTAAAKHGPWMNAAVLVSLATGIRQGELLRLQWQDIDFEKKSLVVLISKTATARAIHMNDPAAAALKKLRRDGIIGRKHVFIDEQGNPAGPFYLAWRWKQVRKAAGLQDFRWHDLRHTTASILAQSGASLLEIGGILGHKSPSMTMRYSHLIAGKAVTGSDKLAEKLS